MINPATVMKIMSMKNKFNQSHPKFGAFLKAVSKDSVVEGTIVEIKVTSPAGDEKVTNLKLNQSDIEMLYEIKNLGAAK